MPDNLGRSFRQVAHMRSQGEHGYQGERPLPYVHAHAETRAHCEQVFPELLCETCPAIEPFTVLNTCEHGFAMEKPPLFRF
jgi:hypothetical protein